MSNVPVDGESAWAQIDNLYRIRGDRLFADVKLSFRDGIKRAVTSGIFEGVDGSLHTPPPGFIPGQVVQARDSFGNLQLTFFSSSTAPLTFKVDADIDDAAGIGHAFQVIDHIVTNTDTNPSDIRLRSSRSTREWRRLTTCWSDRLLTCKSSRQLADDRSPKTEEYSAYIEAPRRELRLAGSPDQVRTHRPGRWRVLLLLERARRARADALLLPGTFSPGPLPCGDACSISAFISAPTRIARLDR